MDRPSQRYDSVSIALHWLIGIGIIVVGVAEMVRGEFFPRGSAPREILRVLHEPAGLIVFGLILLRIVWRLAHRPPAMPSGMQPWEFTVAKLTHWLLYALMIAVPILGLATTIVRGRPIDFGLFQIPLPFTGTIARSTARLVKEMHEATSQGLLALAFVHALAAIWHHHVRKDDVLTRMLPERPQRQA